MILIQVDGVELWDILLDDDMDNDSNGEDDSCDIERWRDLGVPVDSVDENGSL